MSWLNDLRFNPVTPLLTSQHPAIEYATRKDVLHESVHNAETVLWGLKIPQSILRKQNSDGSWTYPTQKSSKHIDYDQLETYRQLGFLIEMFRFTRQHPAITKAAEYIFAKQSSEGDIRGIYARQYSPNYTAALLELLTKAGYANDPCLQKAFTWLDNSRQNDGGWALAFRTQSTNLDTIYNNHSQLSLDKSKPFSHLITGVVLRAYAAHPTYRKSDAAKEAAALLISRLFERDTYPDRNRKDDWTRFSFPFWQTDLLSSLNTIGIIQPSLAREEKALQAKEWFIAHQESTGLFSGHLLKDRYHDLQYWYSYAICRAFNRLESRE